MKFLNTMNVPVDLPVVRVPAMGTIEFPTPEIKQLLASGHLVPVSEGEPAEETTFGEATSSTETGEGSGGPEGPGEGEEGASEQLAGAADLPGLGASGEGSGEVADGAGEGLGVAGEVKKEADQQPETQQTSAKPSRKK